MGLTQPFHNQEDLENLTSRTHQKLSNMKVYVAILLALAIFLLLMCTVEAQSRSRGMMMAYRARQMRAIRARQMYIARMIAMHGRRRRNRRQIPPWVYYKAPNAKGEKKIELEDLHLWKSMDLNKDGKLTIAEYERFSRSAGAQQFVRNMKEHKAVEQWAAKIGIDVAKAKAAMMLGANAQRRRSYINHQRNSRIMAHRRRHAIYRRNQMIAYKRRQQRQNYFTKLGINPFLRQQYYTAMKQSGRRGGEL